MHKRNLNNNYTASKPAGKKKIAAAMLSIVMSICLFGCQKKESAYFLEETASVADNTKMQERETQTIELQTAEAQIAEKAKESEDAETFFVYVCGAVQNPGVYELAEGSRIFEAISLAGGFCEDACEDYINQAQEITDAMKIYIPTTAQVESGEFPMEEAGRAQAQYEAAEEPPLVNINTADKETLLTLTGIGESRAEAIIAYRENNGGFAAIEDIMKVSGIKEGAFMKIKDKICVK